jgi:hypothetical protein
MRIEAHNKFGKPIGAEVTRLIVYDEYDNPIVVALDPGDGSIVAATADPDPSRNAEFHDILRVFGVQRTLIVKDLQQIPLANLNIPR